MKTIQIKRFGVDNLELVDIPLPIIKPNEVLVRITAAALQYLDLQVINGLIDPKLPLPHTPVSEGAGIVEKVGKEVTKWKTGDRVLINFIQKWLAGKTNNEANSLRIGLQIPGTLAEYMAVPEYGLVASPPNLTDEEASTLPVSGLTAWTNLVSNADVKAGQTVLIQGSGSVSLFALQIANTLGVKIIASTGDDKKFDKLKALGAHETFNYKKHKEWSKEVKRLNGGKGVDFTIDVGGSSTISQSILSCREHGYVAVIGFLTGGNFEFDAHNLIMNYIRLQGYSVGSRVDLENLVSAVEVNNIKPIIDTVYPLSKTREAFKYLETGKSLGKVIIKL
ncbi:zinc-dependent alcohol dehydrogenase family protein [Mucilaginibacter lappiensis]|uniref:NADPH:quinone reductase-like Zn-dependent oxidoreductase n=1 Tax=Mucilaginibacter lappiensis TaxID=354630 RepID=A0A1N7FRX1_9SPHI|nr:NAD(P)-dependent alcohol dehydrogenase [Mucilaginibacter lappiensis]MBB6112557.1 NADPH:quinone reductase-like Zn-dependent oxidoreductase [Mucilaginibacter lappiensis]MBB6129205.1 NADPH:quinone reductase-like Zn-dependent oxidoreductase [Mucilaginibacter lappiensis]SIS03099.1 NADPH:quinone reductase [Mucilaginibacter lappiensis]